MQIKFSKENKMKEIIFKDTNYLFRTKNDYEFMLFSLQFLRHIKPEERNRYLGAIGYMCCKQYEYFDMNVGEMFRTHPQELQQTAILTKIYLSNRDDKILGIENISLIFAMGKIVGFIVDIIDSNIMLNIGKGDDLFGMESEDLLYTIYNRRFIDDLMDIKDEADRVE